jgi:hypothetical protein
MCSYSRQNKKYSKLELYRYIVEDLPAKKTSKKPEKPKHSSSKKIKVAPKRKTIMKSKKKKAGTVNPLSTSSYDSWLDSQVSERIKHPRTAIVESPPHLQPPANTFDSWLRNQPVVEKESVLSSTVVVRTYDDWISKQVAARKLEPEEELKTEAVVVEDTHEISMPVEEEGEVRATNDTE